MTPRLDSNIRSRNAPPRHVPALDRSALRLDHGPLCIAKDESPVLQPLCVRDFDRVAQIVGNAQLRTDDALHALDLEHSPGPTAGYARA